MALAAREAGLEYLAITDHSKALAMANGLDEHRALAHARRVREIGDRLEGITLLAGIECDIRADGSMDLADDCLAELDVVVASVHSAFNQDETQMTDRMLRAIANPFVDIIGHPTGRILLRRDPYKLDVGRLIAAAAEAGVALEINCQVDRLDLSDTNAKAARDRGVKIVISTDSHARGGFRMMKWGVQVARRAWLTKEDVLNTRSVAEFQGRAEEESEESVTKNEERQTNRVTRVTLFTSRACDLLFVFPFSFFIFGVHLPCLAQSDRICERPSMYTATLSRSSSVDIDFSRSIAFARSALIVARVVW